jgi:uncharacterized protein (TIGR02145 family)
MTLATHLGGLTVAGEKMKSIEGWVDDGNGTNESGFSGFPGGSRDLDGTFYGIDGNGFWWSSSSLNPGLFAFRINTYYDYLTRADYVGGEGFGFSIRCVRD